MSPKSAKLPTRVRDISRPDPGAGGGGSMPASSMVAAAGRVLLDEGPPTCVTNSRGLILYTNAAYDRIAAALAAAGVDLGARPLEDSNRAPRAWKPAAGEIAIRIEGRNERFRLNRRPLDPDGEGTAVTLWVFTPVTAEQVKSAALAAAGERHDDFVRLVSDWIWETNRDLILTLVSPRVNEALGYLQVELTGRRLVELPVRPNPVLNALATDKGRRPFRDLEIEIADRGGRVRQFLFSGLPFYCPDSGDFLGFRGTAQDITEQKSRQEALIHAKDAAEQASRTKSAFLANMSHELRTPLNAIIGFSEMMAGEVLGPLGGEKYRGYADDIAQSARHLLVLITDVLDTAKVESGQMTLNEETFAPVEVAESVRRLVAARLEHAELTFEVCVSAALPRLRADRTKLKQILINLIANGIKFTGKGGRIELRAEVNGRGEMVLSVSDTGIGIDAEDIPVALAPFGQVDTRLSRKFEGSGLGLPLAKSLIELHGGAFELTSQPKVGTTATLRLPAERVIFD